LDSAYLGFASGSIEQDTFSVRYFASMGFEMFVSQSYAKNMGLYGERIGSFSCLTSTDSASIIVSQLKIIIRQLYSSPPLFGARIVHMVLSDPDLRREWQDCLTIMSSRIREMRILLRTSLEKNTPGTWGHITSQIGMFSYLGITKEQAQRLVKEFHIYLLDSGRISMPGLNERNIDYVVNALHRVITEK